MFNAMKAWARKIEDDPARKRRFAIWSILAVVGLFVVAVGFSAALSKDNLPAESKSAEAVERKAQPKKSPPSSESPDYLKIVGTVLACGVLIFLLVMVISSSIRGQRYREAQRVFGFDQYGRPVQIYPQRTPSWLYVLLFFWLIDDD